MSKEQRRALMLRWSVITAVAIALYWVIWYVMYGYMPVVTEICIWRKTTVALPFGIPRWFDFLIGPICSVLTIWSLELITLFDEFRIDDGAKKFLINNAILAGMFSSWSFSIGLIMAGFIEGLVSGFIFSLTASLGSFLFVYALMLGLEIIAVICIGISRLIANSSVPSFVSGIAASHRWSGFRRLGRWLVAADKNPQS